jgi:hypothetical protein
MDCTPKIGQKGLGVPGRVVLYSVDKAASHTHTCSAGKHSARAVFSLSLEGRLNILLR